MNSIWIIAENLPWAAVLVSAAKSIKADARIVAFVNEDEVAAGEAVVHGAAAAFALPLPADGLWEGYAPSVLEKAEAEKPAFILLSASKRCRDMAAQLAAGLDAPCFSGGRNITVQGDTVTAQTLVYGGAAVQTTSCSAPTVLATIGAKDFDPAPADTSRSGPVATLAYAGGPAKVSGRQARKAQGVNLADAAKVVSIGRGFEEENQLAAPRELAAAIGAEVACSRPIAEFFKWMPEECYVGISGQALKPRLYLAIGISGQAQHSFGVRDAKTIVSINKDAECLMNRNADYYIVGDWKQVVPALMKALKGE